jgi:hypothetical protein
MLLLQPFRLCVLEAMKNRKPPEVVGRSFWCRCKDFVARLEADLQKEDIEGAEHFADRHGFLHGGRECGAFRIEKRGLCNYCMNHEWPLEADEAGMKEAYEKWWTERARMRCREVDLRNPWNTDLEQNDQPLQPAPAKPLPRRVCAGPRSDIAVAEGSSASGAAAGAAVKRRRRASRTPSAQRRRAPSAQRRRARSPSIVIAGEVVSDLQHEDDRGHNASRRRGSGSSSPQRQHDRGHDRERVRGHREGRAASSRQRSRGRGRASGTVHTEPSRHYIGRGVSVSLSRGRDLGPSSTRLRRRSSSPQRQHDRGHDREQVRGHREGRVTSSRQRSRGRGRASGTVHTEPSRHYLGRRGVSVSRSRGRDLRLSSRLRRFVQQCSLKPQRQHDRGHDREQGPVAFLPRPPHVPASFR